MTENMMNYIKEDTELNENDINSMTENELFEACLNCEGIFGYAEKIKDFILEIYGIDLNF